MATKQNLTVLQGETFEATVRWETTPLIYKPITTIRQAAPVSIDAAAHGVPNGWRVAVIDVKGMTELNAATQPPGDSDFHNATVIDTGTIELNEISSALYKAYKSGGSLVYYTPHDLAGYTARMSIKDRIGGTVLAALTTENDGIVIDAGGKTILLYISPADTAAFTWKSGVYDLELVSPTGRVSRILSGSVSLSKEAST